MFNETTVTLQGNVGGDVQLRTVGDTVAASFRVACTPRRYSRRSGEWADAVTQWYTVNVWRALAEHCAASLHRGDPVVVHGRVDVRPYVNKAGVEVVDLAVDAVAVGHDLARGTSVFTRERRQPPAGQPVAAPEVGEAGEVAAVVEEERAA
jgi:single-strand DNA-binding protein